MAEQIGFCKGCGKIIHWQKMPSGANMPLEVEVITVITEDGKTVRGKITHWSTCPQAKKFKKVSAETKGE